MTNHVRRATPLDADAILAIGASDPAFRVSDRVSFYEREELVEWAIAPQDNLLFVSEGPEGFTGFCFCKVMSSHWAVLDNFYVVPSRRGTGTAEALRTALLGALHERHVRYVSTLVALDDRRLAERLSGYGFRQSRDYGWLEVFLGDEEGVSGAR